MSDTRPAIRCLHCKLNQFVGEYCRRCRKPLPQVAQEVLQNRTPEVAFGHTLPTMREWQNALIDEALKRCRGSHRRAAELIGMSHTTIWKHLKQSEHTL